MEKSQRRHQRKHHQNNRRRKDKGKQNDKRSQKRHGNPEQKALLQQCNNRKHKESQRVLDFPKAANVCKMFWSEFKNLEFSHYF